MSAETRTKQITQSIEITGKVALRIAQNAPCVETVTMALQAADLIAAAYLDISKEVGHS